MGALAVVFPLEASDGKYQEMTEYLSSEGGYWLREDKWRAGDEGFRKAGIKASGKKELVADFGSYASENLKTEMKYYLLFSMKEKYLTAYGISHNYLRAVQNIGEQLGRDGTESFEGLPGEADIPAGLEGTTEGRVYRCLYSRVVSFITDYYDERDEFEKDTWHARRIPGVRQSAAEKRLCHSISFEGIPEHYRGMVKRFLSRLIVRRSWSYCKEMLMYIKYFFRVFYGNGYGDGFFRTLGRRDMERYLPEQGGILHPAVYRLYPACGV